MPPKPGNGRHDNRRAARPDSENPLMSPLAQMKDLICTTDGPQMAADGPQMDHRMRASPARAGPGRDVLINRASHGTMGPTTERASEGTA